MAVNVDLLKKVIQRRNERLDELFGLERLAPDRNMERAASMDSWTRGHSDTVKRDLKSALKAKKAGNRKKRKADLADALLARRHRKASRAAAKELRSRSN